MDAQAHLLSLGWAGPGHPLHPSAYKQKGHRGLAYDPTTAKSSFTQNMYPSNGLIKPLLVSQKQGKLGVGKRAHEPQAGNEWWLKGFEKALGDVGKSGSERSSGTSTPVVVPANGGKFGALYSFFVRGGEMEGTIGDEERKDVKRGKKRKSDALDEDKREFEEVATFMGVRDKDEKRRQRKEKASAEEQFKAVEEFMAVREGKQRNKRKSENMEVLDVASETPAKARRLQDLGSPDGTADSPAETKEERRARRQRRREEKEARRPAEQEINGGNHHDEDAAAKALRKAEKKRRKAEKATKDSLT